MTKALSLYIISSFIEITLSAIALFLYFKFRNNNFDQTVDGIVSVIVLSLPFFFGLKLILSSKKYFRKSETFVIVGHIANVIKLLFVLLLIIGEVYFFTGTVNVVNPDTPKGLLYYITFSTLFLWNLISLYNFFGFIQAAKHNIKVKYTDLDNIGSQL